MTTPPVICVRCGNGIPDEWRSRQNPSRAFCMVCYARVPVRAATPEEVKLMQEEPQ
jgi:ribosomal protein L40E